MKKTLTAALMAVTAMGMHAQSGTNSPYSQYGLGVLADQSTGFNRGMNGLSYGFHDGNQVNYMNPASYAAMDSLTFLFDVGLSGQVTNFKEGGKRLNANNASFEYAVAGFRLFRHTGMSFGILPYTNIGFDYSTSGYVNAHNTMTYTNTYSGSGGLHQVYVGLGVEPFKHFSLGLNGGYLWGNLVRSATNSYSDRTVNTLSKYYSASVSSYILNAGVQYSLNLGKADELTLGLTYSFGHKIGGAPTCRVISTNSQTAVADTSTYGGSGIKLEMPHAFGAGFMYSHAGKLRFGVDYNLQKWGSIDFPVYTTTSETTASYEPVSGYYKDRHKVTAGFEYLPSANSKKFFQRMHYRAGVSYATPYLKVNGADGPKEISASIGFGIPIVNVWTLANGRPNHPILNISGQWVRNAASGLVTENMFRINIGLTFNESWFEKWKVR